MDATARGAINPQPRLLTLRKHTMRKIDLLTKEAFWGYKNFKQGNTEVVDGNVYLHGNKIVSNDGAIFVSFCGWSTQTTKNRINAIISGCNLGQFYIRKGQLMFKHPEGKGVTIDPYLTYRLSHLAKESIAL